MPPSNIKKIKDKTGHCPVCKKSTEKSFRPFCSKHCADVDLSRWLNGHYAIPVVEEDGSIPTEPLNDNFEH